MPWNSLADVLENVALITGCLLAAGWALSAVGISRSLFEVSKLYGEIPYALQTDVFRYAAYGPLAVWQSLPFALFLFGIGAFIWHGIADSWTSGLVQFGVFAFGCCLFRSMVFVRFGLPPAVLLLGPSGPEAERTLATLNEELKPYRTVALIRPDQAQLQGRLRYSVLFNNFRTRDLYQWRTIVFHLMDVVPVIVICDGPTDPVREERARIERRGYGDRTISTRREELADENGRRALRDLVAARLERVDDQEARRARQNDILRMRLIIPRYLNYPRTDAQFVHKAKLLTDVAQARFLQRCKEPDGWTPGDLLEDIPSRVSREEELRFLHEDRMFEEVEILLRSVHGQQRPGSNQEFNRINLINKKGLLHRLRGEWPEAHESLDAAIRLFERMNVAEQASDPQVLQELGTAYFNLGDVCLAQFRETHQEDHRKQAHYCFERSLSYDQQWGGDLSVVKRRLALA
jgi:tetratricopeptide (TPR) repeat protein